MRNLNNGVFITDTEEDKLLIEKSRPYGKLLSQEFKKKIAVENLYRGMHFWLWFSFAVETLRIGLLLLYNQYTKTPMEPILFRIFLSLYWWVWAFTVVCLCLCLYIRKQPQKHTELITFAGDIYMLLYLVRGVGLTIMEVESGIIGFSLITALFVAGFVVVQRPIIACSNILLAVASFVGTVLHLKLKAFAAPGIIFSLVTVAFLSLILSCSNYHSKYVAFLREKSISMAKDKVNNLNVELSKKKTQIELQNEQLQILSSRDSLTTLRNRHCFVADAKALMEKNYAQNRFLTLAIADVDNFKHINDAYGHTVGDACLYKIGSILTDMEEEKIHAYRFGGDEFVILFDGKSRADAFLYMNRFLKEISNIEMPHFDGMVSASVGIFSDIPKQDESIDTYIEKADKAMYVSKNSGKNRIMTYYQNGPTIQDEMIK